MTASGCWGEAGLTDARPPRFRFGIGSLMLVTIVVGITAAAARQYVRANEYGTSPRALFVMFTLAAPLLVLVTLSVIHQGVGWLSRRQLTDSSSAVPDTPSDDGRR